MNDFASFLLRPYHPDDVAALFALFLNTVRRVNSRDYNAEQIRAWASDETDFVVWKNRFVGRFAVVAVDEVGPIGFTDLEDDGHVDRFYVSADHQRRGVGHRLLTAVIDEAERRGLPRLYAEVSITARPFFAAHGFIELAQQTVVYRGVEFINYRMQRDLQVN